MASSYTQWLFESGLQRMNIPSSMLDIKAELEKPDSEVKRQVGRVLNELMINQRVEQLLAETNRLTRELLDYNVLEKSSSAPKHSAEQPSISASRVHTGFEIDLPKIGDKTSKTLLEQFLSKQTQIAECELQLTKLMENRVEQVKEFHQDMKEVLGKANNNFLTLLSKKITEVKDPEQQRNAQETQNDFQEQLQQIDEAERKVLASLNNEPDPIVRMERLKGTNMKRELMLEVYGRKFIKMDLLKPEEMQQFRAEFSAKVKSQQAQEQPLLTQRKAVLTEMRKNVQELTDLSQKVKKEMGITVQAEKGVSLVPPAPPPPPSPSTTPKPTPFKT